MLNFADGNLSVTRGLKQCERFESALATRDGLPDFLRVATGRGHDAQTRDDWETFGHRKICHAIGAQATACFNVAVWRFGWSRCMARIEAA